MRLRPLIAALCLLVLLGLGIAVSVLPRMRGDEPGVIAVPLLIAALVAGGGALWRRVPLAAYGAVLLAVLALVPFTVIARGFGRVDMMAVLFHAGFGMEGATLEGLSAETFTAIVAGVMILIATWALGSLWRLGARPFLALAAGLLALNPGVQFLAGSLLRPAVASDLATRLAVPVITADAPRPDILIIYLEGLDRRFADRDTFADAYDPILELETQAIRFDNVGQIVGTAWSLAGMVASQCGIPVLPKGLLFKNNFETVERFLPGATCLGDLLVPQGYRAEYVVGGDLQFGGIDNFYRTHAITGQTGFDEQRALYPTDTFEAANIDWILDDQMTFDTAEMKLDSLLPGTEPFLMVVETIGPHGAVGYLARRCSEDGRGKKTRNALAVVHCTASLARDFVQLAQARHAAARPEAPPLHVVVVSDHLSHNAEAPAGAPHLAGRNTALFLRAGQVATVVDRPASMIDILPSLLDWAGLSAAPVAAGLGRSMLSPAPTLVEEYGIETLDAMLRGDGDLAARLWAEPGAGG
jgi:phosphoglycerol transferase